MNIQFAIQRETFKFKRGAMNNYTKIPGTHHKCPRQTWTSGPLIIGKMLNLSLRCRKIKMFLLNLGICNAVTD